MAPELNNITRLYDTVAKEYSKTFSGEHEKKPKDREILRRFSREIGDEIPVWDIGCGPGHTTKYLINHGIEVSGLDISDKILEQARKNYPEIHFRKGNLLKLVFENDSIAGIVAFYAIVHFTEEQVGIAFREVFRILKPKGIFLFTYHIGEEPIHVDEYLGKKVDIELMLFNTEFIVSCLQNCGYVIIDVIYRDPYPEVEYDTRRAYVFAKKPVVTKSP